MKKTKKAPYILLFILSSVVILIFGVNIGKNVAEKNKEYNYQLSHAPSKPVTPTTSKPLMFETYTNENCGVQFLYPSSLTLKKESSTSAEFQEGKTSSLVLNCDRTNALNSIIDNKNIKTENITLLQRSIPAKLVKDKDRDFYIFRIQNPLTRKGINISIVKTVYPLFRESFQFLSL